MTNSLPNQEVRDSNSSALFAVYLVLRRQPWKAMAFKTWDTMKRFVLFAVLAASLSGLAPAVAHARMYEIFSVNVPFKFNVGDRTFKPGQYQFIPVNPGVVAVRDSHAHVIATLTTRPTETGGITSTSKLVFKRQNNRARLAQIWIGDPSRGMDVVGEESAAGRSTGSVPPDPMLSPDVLSLFERRAEPGFKR